TLTAIRPGQVVLQRNVGIEPRRSGIGLHRDRHHAPSPRTLVSVSRALRQAGQSQSRSSLPITLSQAAQTVVERALISSCTTCASRAPVGMPAQALTAAAARRALKRPLGP